MKVLKNIITGFLLCVASGCARAAKSIKGFFVCDIRDTWHTRMVKNVALAVLSFAMPFVFAFFLGCYDERPYKAPNGRTGSTGIQPPKPIPHDRQKPRSFF